MIPPGALLHGDSLDGFTASGNDVIQNEVRCGVGCNYQYFSSPCLQRFATAKCFLTVLIVTCILQGAAQGYLSVTASVIAQRFDFPASFVDWLLLGHELSQALVALLIAYGGGRGHRPSWLAACIFLQASCYILIVAPLIKHGSKSHYVNTTITQEDGLCSGESTTSEPLVSETCWITMIILVVAQLCAGIGLTSFLAHGLTYLDDNMEKADIPSHFGAVLCARQLGPKFGEVMAYQFSALSGAASGNLVSEYELNGVWWLGWPLLATLLLIVALLISMFPLRLPSMAVKEAAASILELARGHVQISEERQYIMDPPNPNLLPTLRRIFGNRMVICNILATILMHTALTNFLTFENRYLESVYHIPKPQNTGGVFQDPWISRVTTGFLKPPMVGMALLVSGLLISKNKPRPTVLAAWNIITAVLAAIIFFTFISLGCPLHSIYGDDSGRLTLNQNCNRECYCPITTPFTPVCDKDGINTYYSPCHAGCSSVEVFDNLKLYKNCKCVTYGDYAKGGPCNYPSCTGKWVMYQSFTVLLAVLLGTGVVGNLLLCLRCVVQQDKPVALGLEMMLVGLMHVPVKMLYKGIADSTCKHWGDNSYTCRLFHSNSLIIYINVLSGCLLLLSAVFDGFVWLFSRNLQLYADDELEGFPEQIEMDEIQKQKLMKRHATPAARRRHRDAKTFALEETETTEDVSDGREPASSQQEVEDLLQADSIDNAVVLRRKATLV